MTLSFVLLATLLCAAQHACADLVTSFKQANEAYTGGRYEDAIRQYESIIQEGKESGELYYNLGNSYYKAGQTGKAVLNYERAKRLIPRDSELKSNHEYVLSQIKNYFAGGTRPFLSRWLHQYKDNLTLDEITYAGLFLWLVAGTLVLLAFTRKWPKERAFIILTPLAALLAFHIFLFSLKTSEDRHAAILLKEVQARYEPVPDSTVYFSLPEGAKVAVVEQAGLWMKIQRPDGKLGWVEGESVEKIILEKTERGEK